VCAVYLSGIGCPNCSEADPVLLTQITQQFPYLIILKYEIYHARQDNETVQANYFASYIPRIRPGVPFLVFNKRQYFIGKTQVVNVANRLEEVTANPFPLSDGTEISFKKLDFTSLPGKFTVWTKNRVLISGTKANNNILKKVLIAPDINHALKGVDFKVVQPFAVEISGGKINFDQAVLIGDWRLQWNGEDVKVVHEKAQSLQHLMFWLIVSLILLGFALTMLRVEKTPKGKKIRFEWRSRMRDLIVVGVSFLSLSIFFVAAKNISPDFLEKAGYSLPLPVFTFIIGFLDGFNPCNMFVLTCLLTLLISSSASKFRLYMVSLIFVLTVFLFYFLFMAAWLNVFNYISFVKPLRIGIAVLGLIVGFINCKELFFFKKGISLTISEGQKGPLKKKMEELKNIVQSGSFPVLLSSSFALAVLSSLVELPCTAGFPIIYTAVLVGKGFSNTWIYYAYLVFYNILYVFPLIVIVVVLIYTFRSRQITQRHMEIIKYVGGIIMILLGIILLVNPALIGISMG